MFADYMMLVLNHWVTLDQQFTQEAGLFEILSGNV